MHPQLLMGWILVTHQAAIAQLGERQTEDLKVPGSIPGLGSASMRQHRVRATALRSQRARRAATIPRPLGLSEAPGSGAGIGGCPLGGGFRARACACAKCTSALRGAPCTPASDDQHSGHALPAAIAQLGERQTEDLKVSSSILGLGMFPPAPAPRVGLGGRDFSFRA